jgi:hypothetical protein
MELSVLRGNHVSFVLGVDSGVAAAISGLTLADGYVVSGRCEYPGHFDLLLGGPQSRQVRTRVPFVRLCYRLHGPVWCRERAVPFV